jgi:predicted PurR-regulated permease PerM
LSLLQIDDLEKKVILLVKELDMFFSTYDINLSNEISSILKSFDFSFLTDFLNGFLSFLGDSTITLFSVTFISFFLLKDSSLLLRVITIISPETKKLKVKNSFEKIVILLSRYFNGLLLQITILFIFYSLILLIFGVKNAVTIALICALLNIIPYLGPLIGGFLITFLTLTSNLGLDIGSSVLLKTLGVFVGFCIGQLIDNFISQPYIFSKSVKSHPLEIFIIIILAGLIAGALGMLIAVPIYTVIKVVLSEFFGDIRFVKELTKNI